MTRPRSRSLTVVAWVLQVALALWFLGSASGKLTGEPGIVATFDALGPFAWLRYAVAVLEIAGAVGLLVPALAGLAAACLALLMVGAVVVTVATATGSLLPPVATLVVCAVLAAVRWSDVRALLARRHAASRQ